MRSSNLSNVKEVWKNACKCNKKSIFFSIPEVYIARNLSSLDQLWALNFWNGRGELNFQATPLKFFKIMYFYRCSNNITYKIFLIFLTKNQEFDNFFLQHLNIHMFHPVYENQQSFMWLKDVTGFDNLIRKMRLPFLGSKLKNFDKISPMFFFSTGSLDYR